jgi:hypothetical protein
MRATSPSGPHLLAVQRRQQFVTHRLMLLRQVEQRVELRLCRADVEHVIVIDHVAVVVDVQPPATLQCCPSTTGAQTDAELGCDAIRNGEVLEVGARDVTALRRQPSAARMSRDGIADARTGPSVMLLLEYGKPPR